MPMTVQTLVASQQERINLQWLAGHAGADRALRGTSVHAVDQIGYLNLMHAERIAVLGPRELAWYGQLDEAGRSQLHDTLASAHPPALVLSDSQQAPPELVQFCNQAGMALLGCPLPAGPLIEALEQALSYQGHTSLHGVLMDVQGMGVLITGDSGLGKSELALELISRGHGLVADDVVDIERIGQHTIIGRCPPMLQGLLEVRGLGLIDIRTIYGESAVRRRMPIKLIVHLVGRRALENAYERLPLQALTETILGVPVRKVAVPVAAGRNIAVLTETAVQSTILLLRGIDTTREFTRRQQQIILGQQPDPAMPAAPPFRPARPQPRPPTAPAPGTPDAARIPRPDEAYCIDRITGGPGIPGIPFDPCYCLGLHPLDSGLDSTPDDDPDNPDSSAAT